MKKSPVVSVPKRESESVSAVDAAHVVARYIQQNPRTPGHLYTWNDLLRMTQAPSMPAKMTSAEYQSHQFWLLTFRETLVELVAEMTGRVLQTVHGVGYSLLAPGTSITYVESKAAQTARRAATKGRKLLSTIRDGELTMEERRRKLDADVRLGMLYQAAKRVESEAVCVDKTSVEPKGLVQPRQKEKTS